VTTEYDGTLPGQRPIPGHVDPYAGPVTAAREAGADFSETIRTLLTRPDLDDYFENAPDAAAALTQTADALARRAYGAGDADALHQVHKALYLLYEENLRPSGTRHVFNQYNPQLIGVRNRLERHWEGFEMARIAVEPASVPVDADAFRAYFRALCASHEMVGHRLFDFLNDAATREDLTGFFLSDAAVIVRFCDLVVMSMVGVEDEVRPELAENFWDEMGRGRFQERHVHLYRNLLEYAGVNLPGDSLVAEDFSDHLKWQGLAGYNLYLFLCLHRKNQFRSLGALGAAEMMDPDQYRKVLAGCRRVGLEDDTKLAYYAGHAEMDVAHGDGWCDNVLVPLVQRYPERRHEIVEGALMRMNITCDYFDDLYQRLSAEHRAA
jgi:hypothetical protein